VASFKAAYGQDFIPMGVGQTLRLPVDPVVAVTVAPESVVVGTVVDWSARFKVSTPGSGATTGRLSADLSAVGGAGVVDRDPRRRLSSGGVYYGLGRMRKTT
jgi:hypothetical protein